MSQQPSTVIVSNTERSTLVTSNPSSSTSVTSTTGGGTYNLKESGTSTLDGLVDVSTSGRFNNDVLKYNSASGRWIPSAHFVILDIGETVPSGLRPGTMIFRRSS